MSAQTSTQRLSARSLGEMKQAGTPIAVLTAYDASFANLCDQAEVDILIVGDSLGMVLQGHDSTLPVTLDDIAYHVACVKRGCQRPLIIADMPFASFNESPEQAFRNAAKLMAAGAQMVKLEGGLEIVGATRFLSQRGIPVCGHIGLTPQYVHSLGGYRVQGKDAAGRKRLLDEALALQRAGASLMLLEAMPEEVGTEIAEALAIPTIGIGAGRYCAGQVLVLHDMLDISPGKKAKFVRNFMNGAPSISGAIASFVQAIRDGSYPGQEHCY